MMAYDMDRQLQEMKKRHRRRVRRQKVVGALCCVVVFCVVYSLILPAISMTGETYCGRDERQHGSECFEKQLVCGYDENAETGHVHSDSCYEEQKVLICGQEESAGHVHDESCIQTEQQLICTEDQEHTADCYETVTTYICEETEGEGSHTHEAACYETQKVLICEIPEREIPEEPHAHTEDCYEEVLIFQLEEHEHSLACHSNPEADVETAMDWEKTVQDVELTGNYAADLLQIAQTQLGYAESGENYAVETDPDIGAEKMKGYTRYGAWYGDAYGDWCAMYISFCLNYADISAEDFPREASYPGWMEFLQSEDWKLYHSGEEDYMPNPGDLVFFDWNQDGEADHVGIVAALSAEESDKLSETDREKALNETIQALTIRDLPAESSEVLAASGTEPLMAEDSETVSSEESISTEDTEGHTLMDAENKTIENTAITTAEETEIPAENDTEEPAPETIVEAAEELGITLITIEGNSGNKVQTQAYSLTDESILGYGQLPLTGYQNIYAAMQKIFEQVKTFDSEQTEELQTLCMDAYMELSDLLDMGYDAYDAGRFTEEQLASLESLFDDIIVYMQDEYGFDPYGVSVAAYSSATVQVRPYVSTFNSDASLSDSVNHYTRTLIGDGPIAVDGALSAGSNNKDCLIPVSWLQTVYSGSGYTFDENNPGTSPFDCYHNDNYCGEAGNNGVALVATSYVKEGDAWYVHLTSNSDVTEYALYYAALEEFGDAVTPSSTVIHMFDYWTTPARTDSDNKGSVTAGEMNTGINYNHLLKFGKQMGETYGDLNYSRGGTATPSAITQGIVANKLGTNDYPCLSGKTYSGNNVGSSLSTTESLAYLFDPTEDVDGKQSFTNVSGLLWRDSQGYYCYDCTQRAAELDKTNNHITEYSSPAAYVSGGTVNETGFGYGQFFPFNSARQSAMLQTEKDPINHYFGMSMTTRFIQEHDGYTNGTKDTPMVFEFSGDNDVWIYIDDVLVADLGGLRSAASVTINFATGEVAIKNDYGTEATAEGANRITTIKDAFVAAGVTWGNGESNTFANNTTHTLKFYYLERGNYDSNIKLRFNLTEIPPTSIYKVNQYGNALGGATFAVYAADENWNYIATDGTKVQVPKNAEGVSYGSEWDMTYEGHKFDALYYGTTNDDGEMVFLDADGIPYSLSELQSMFGDHFILREVDVPDGYRTVSDDAYLYIENGVLQTADPYGTGVWASPNAQVTARNTLYVADKYSAVAGTLAGSGSSPVTGNETDGYEIDYYDPSGGSVNGTLFAVVLKRNGASIYNVDTWSPVYGSDEAGYTVIDPVKNDDGTILYYEDDGKSYNSQIEAVIHAATIATQSEKIRGEKIFQYSASGMQVTLENMPGDITRYFTYMWNQRAAGTTYEDFLTEYENSLDPQYFVAYYWTSANSLEEANAANTVRVVSREGVINGYNGFNIQWGTTIEVPNMENRLFFQKLNEDGELVNGATFALYNAIDAVSKDGTQTYVYYVGTDSETNNAAGNTVYVALLSEDQCTDACNVAAFLKTDADTPQMVGYGTYAINGEDGKITVTITDDKEHNRLPVERIFYVFPATNAEGTALVGETHASCDFASEEGTGHFIRLNEGNFYLREISAPAGYALNGTNIPVLVNEYGVYAYAGSDDGTESGTADDGVAVGNGIGYLSKTLDVFASEGEIDETLTWIYAALLRNNTVGFSAFDEVSGDVIHVTETNSWYFVKDEDSVETDPGYGSAITTSRSEAMVTYLTYNGALSNDPTRRSIFDYTPTVHYNADGVNDGQAAREMAGNGGCATVAGQNTIRLYVNSGWSDLAVYQDYAYGSVQTSAGTNYLDLTPKGNISNLFSSSTFVRVTDKPYLTDIEIKKTDAANSGNFLSGAQFRLYRIITETADDGTVTETKQYYGAGADAVTWVTDASDALIVTSGESGLSEAFTSLNDGIYYLEECRAPDGFQLLEKAILITVDGTNGVSMNYEGRIYSVDSGAAGWNVKKAETTNGVLKYILTVPNSTGYELPATGAGGTTIFTISGFVLMAVACLFLILRRRLRAGKKYN